MIAMMVAGYMARGGGGAANQSSSGGLGGLVGGLLGGGAGTGSSGIGGLASMLDMDADGNPLDDILNMVRGQRG